MKVNPLSTDQVTDQAFTSDCGTMHLYQGDWKEVLPPYLKPDAVIVDPPFSERTHKGHDSGGPQISLTAARDREKYGHAKRRELSYESWDVDTFGHAIGTWASWEPRWLCVFTSHDLIPTYEAVVRAAGRYVFAPLPVVQKRPRFQGDGPANWCSYLMVSRLRVLSASRWRMLPGLYTSSVEKRAPVAGAKPLHLIRAIVKDYSNPGDLIVDPCAGWGSTLLAAAIEKRRAVGAEIDSESYKAATERLAAGYTPSFDLEEDHGED